MALMDDSTVWCWGYNVYGQLGDGTTTPRLSPTGVSGLAGVTQIGSGANHSLAVTSGGVVSGWGLNGAGQLGD